MTSEGKGLTVLSILAGIVACCMFLVAYAAPASAETSWNVGISGGDKGIDGFHLSVGEYYRVPQREVVIIHDRGIRDEDLPVVFYISRRAHVPPEVIVDLRLRGMNWMDITLHFGLGPDIYYVPVTVIKEHHPHGHAWGYYKKYPKHEDWRRIRLRDEDVVNQVNLKFISEHYGYAPERVMRYRSDGRKFAVIDRDVRNEKHGRKSNDRDKSAKERHSSDKHGDGKKKQGGKDRKDNDFWKEDKHEGKGKK